MFSPSSPNGTYCLRVPQRPLESSEVSSVGGDFNTLTAANQEPRGLWSDGTTMWVVDSKDEKIYAYNMDTKAGTVVRISIPLMRRETVYLGVYGRMGLICG